MSIAYVQNAHVESTTVGTTAVTASFGSPTTSGNLLVVLAGYRPSPGTFNGGPILMDNAGNTFDYINGSGRFSPSLALYLFYAKNITGNAAHTLTGTPAYSGLLSLIALEYSGADTVSPVGQFIATNGNAAAPSAGTITETTGYLIVSALINDVGGAVSAGSGLTLRQDLNNASGATLAVEDALSSGSGLATGFSLGGAANFAALAATFKPAGGGGSMGGGGSPILFAHARFPRDRKIFLL